MRIIETKAFTFEELSSKAQEKAIQEYADINVDYDWWVSTYDDAERIGLEITGFDIDRASYVKGQFIESAMYTAEKIMKEHGDSCDTYKLAGAFLSDWSKLVAKYSDGINLESVHEDNEYDFDREADELEREFEKDLKEEYRSLLSDAYDYLTSEEVIKETITSNGFEFDENGYKI